MPAEILMSLVILLLVSTVLWWQQGRAGNAGWVDVFWSASTGIVGLGFLASGNGDFIPRIVAAVLLAIWSWRLATHIAVRLQQHPDEEGRYVAMRASLGKATQPVFLLFFWGQALLAWSFALPFWVIGQQAQFHWMSVTGGALLGLLAITGEAVADRQLSRFKAGANSQGKTCRQGLWRYSRHPNYFFEWLHWFSYPLIAMGAVAGSWLWLLPLAMLIFLWFVTGIPYTERQAIKSRGDDYRNYQKTTSAFFPWRPQHDD